MTRKKVTKAAQAQKTLDKLLAKAKSGGYSLTLPKEEAQ